MAIQNRRGNYANFDPTKMVAGEFAVVQADDPSASDGKAVYMAFSPNDVKRLATHDELEQYNQEAQLAAEAAEDAQHAAEQALSDVQDLKTTIDTAVQTATKAATDAQQAVADAEDDITAAKDAAVTAAEEEIGEVKDDAISAINTRAEQIVAMTTNAEQIASEARDTANNAENHMASLDSQMREVKEALNDVSIDPDDLGLYQDPDTHYVYPTYKDVVSENGIPLSAGGGGGGDVVSAVLTVDNTTGWLSETIPYGANCFVSFAWSSIEDGMPTGDGNIRITVNDVVKTSYQIQQGNVSVNLAPYINKGANKVKVRISDTYDQGKTITFNVSSIDFSLSSPFDASTVYSSPFTFSYVPVGALEKTVHFIVDGTEIGTQVTSVSNRQMSYTIPAQTHGAHSLRVYFEAVINNETVRSNELYYEFIYVNQASTTPIIASSFNATSMPQYSTIPFSFMVYTPNSLTSEITISINGSVVSTQTVDRTEQSYPYKANQDGTLNFTIASGGVTKTITLTITESEIDVKAETEDLALYLTSQGRSNNEEHPEIWNDTDRSISATLTGFNWASDGWQIDEDGITCLRVAGEARVAIPFNVFANDIRQTGFTVDVEFSTRNVADYNATILSCFSGGRGLKITPQSIMLKSDSTELSMQYKEGEHIRVAYTVDKRSEHRLVKGFIDGTIARAVQYPTDDDFVQATPVGISIGSSDCTIDIYCIRVYTNNLTMQQVLENWIADTQDGTLMLERYTRNNIYDAYGNIVISQLPSYLPYFILNAEELPQYKGDKKIISGSYTDPLFPSKSFTFEGMQINVQGTSSAPYYRKNFDMQFKGGFEMTSGHEAKYKLRTDSIPTNRFVTKADVASSEAVNNTQGVQIYNDLCPYKTPEMIEDPRVRWGIDGFPIVIFWHNTLTDETTFYGKANFNFPKRFPEGYGYTGNDESWEFQNNISNLMLFLTDFFDESLYTDPETGETKERWRYDYEARFPGDTWIDYSKLQILQSFVFSTYRGGATGNPLETPVTYEGTRTEYVEVVDPVTGAISYEEKTYRVDVTYENDTADYRLAKFKAEFGNYAELESFIFYYVFTEFFLMVDSRAKNLFIGFHGGECSVQGLDRKAVAEPYDMDTQMGIDNEGVLRLPPYLEDTDTISGANVFNGQNSVLWNNLRDAFPKEIQQMYQNIRSGGLRYNNVEARFDEAQAKWCEALWNEDGQVKYLNPLVNPDVGKEPTDFYLPMCQGTKQQQRKSWLTNRFAYMDSKWSAGDASAERIQLRGYAKSDITVTPYINLYPTVKYGSYVVSARATAGTPTLLACPIDTLNDTEIYIYSARNVSSVGDLSGLKVGIADFSYATNIQEVKLGDADSNYDNPNMKSINFGNNKLLKKIDCRNCSGLGTGERSAFDISGCEIIEEVYFEGTKITGLSFPNGGVLKKVHLPATITNLTLLNQKNITELVIPSYANISTLRLENVSTAVDEKAILRGLTVSETQIPRVRLIGIHWECTDAAEIDGLLDLLDTMKGLDEQGGNVDKAQVSGTIHTTALTGAQIAEFESRYPYITYDADYVESTLTLMNPDNTTVYRTITCYNGEPQSAIPTPPSKADSSDGHYSYTQAGWNLEPNMEINDPTATTDVVADRTVYPAYTKTVKKYPVTYVRASADGGGTLYTLSNVDWGTTITAASSYGGSTPTTTQGSATDYPFEGWEPASATVTGNTTFTAKFGAPVEVAEITDSWDTIIANIDNGTYSSVYKIGNYKPLDLGTEGTINMQIVAMDADELASGGYAPLTFIGMELLNTPHVMASSQQAVIGWETSDMRTYLNETVLTLIPAVVRNRINNVVKPTFYGRDTGTRDVVDKLWLPSAREVVNGDDVSKEANGISYDLIYVNSTSLIKVVGSSGAAWWLRSSGGGNFATRYQYINTSGMKQPNGQGVQNLNYICLGFCLGLEQETIEDDWSTILANTNPSASYSIGDTKMIDLGTEGKHLMEIVAFDEDDKADGSGKAKITWISKTLLNTAHRMNPANSGGAIGTGGNGGWEHCEMRTYLKNTIKPLIPETVRNAIVNVTKIQSTVTDGTMIKDGQTTTDDVWIPSNYEVGLGTTYESQGSVYSSKFTGNTSRTKKRNGSNRYWWLRSAINNYNFNYVYASGSNSNNTAGNSYGVALGFCTD